MHATSVCTTKRPIDRLAGRRSPPPQPWPPRTRFARMSWSVSVSFHSPLALGNRKSAAAAAHLSVQADFPSGKEPAASSRFPHSRRASHRALFWLLSMPYYW